MFFPGIELKQVFCIILLIGLTTASGNTLFESGKKYMYSYEAELSAGVFLPSRAASSWNLRGSIEIEGLKNFTHLQLSGLKTFVTNGPNDGQSEYTNIDENIDDLTKPLLLVYEDGLITNLSIGLESVWATNIKRSIASIFQIDLKRLAQEVAFHSVETNHYGRCTVEYVVTPQINNKTVLRKFFDPHTCQGHQRRTWTNIPALGCPNGNENPIMKSSERLYEVEMRNNNAAQIQLVNATGEIYIQPFRSLGEGQFFFSKQTIKLIEVINSDKLSLTSNEFNGVSIEYKLPDGDLTQGRGVPSKEKILKYISSLLDRLSQQLENPGLDIHIDNLHNRTISTLLHYLGYLNRSDLEGAYKNISGTSYKEETVRNMFLETLPQIGTKESALFILDLIQQQKVSGITAMQLLTQLPFHIRKPDVQLLVSLQPLLTLPEASPPEVRNTGILTFGTLIYRTCLIFCPYEMLDDYVRLYLDKFTESNVYDKKMIWLEGLSNIQLGRVVEFLEPIASGNSVESRHLRALAAWASLPTATLRPDVIYPVYWPILVNRSEHLEMRIAALTLLIVSNPTANRVISLYWYIQGESNSHLYNYFYTTLKSMESSTFPCYKQVGLIAGKFARILRKPNPYDSVVTGNYIFDYQDIKRNFGTMIQKITIASPSSNMPEVIYMTLKSHASGMAFNDFSLYIKATGLMKSLSEYLQSPTRVKDILKEFKVERRPIEPIHFELIMRVQQKAVLCMHFNETNIFEALNYLSALPANAYHIYKNMEFHVNQQRINVPLTMESIEPSDFGTTVRIAATATSLFSMRGNFTHFSDGRNNHVILRTAIHGSQIIENYNPICDIWHAAERALSINGYFPANITLGLNEKLFISYNTPTEYLRTGFATHSRTTTTIRGTELTDENIKKLCANCSSQYTVRADRQNNHNNENIHKVFVDWTVAELGGKLHIKMFDCEPQIKPMDLLNDIWNHHRSNYDTWSLAKYPLMAMHLLDYLTYVPPSGSCGISFYIETANIQPSQVKFEVLKIANRYMLSLTRSQPTSQQQQKILQQWTIAILYESTSWQTDNIKVKATKTIADGEEKVLKICLEMDRTMPWNWHFLTTKHSDPATIRFNLAWGYSDTAKGKCTGSNVIMNLAAQVSEEQIAQSRQDKWPYKQCRQQSYGKILVPYTTACYQASRELSTMRKYQIFISFDNLPENMNTFIRRIRALYEIISDNLTATGYTKHDNQFIITAIFPPKDSTDSTLVSLNKNQLSMNFNPDMIDVLLTRTRLHRFIDNSLLRTLFSFCAVTQEAIFSSHNATRSVKVNEEYLTLGHCYEQNPGFALTVAAESTGLSLNIYDEFDSIKLISKPNQQDIGVLNFGKELHITNDAEWHIFMSKRFRKDDRSIHIFLTNILTFIHYTPEQILFIFPNYIQEFACGVCTVQSFTDANFYHKTF